MYAFLGLLNLHKHILAQNLLSQKKSIHLTRASLKGLVLQVVSQAGFKFCSTGGNLVVGKHNAHPGAVWKGSRERV